jgi:PAS domain-containing protein
MDAIMVLTNDGTQVLEANKAAAELFDRTRIELLNINRNDLVDTADKRFKKLLRERELTGKYRGILKIIKKDGTTVECDVASVNFVGSDGFEQTHIVLHKR